jgi:DNA modification methylase
MQISGAGWQVINGNSLEVLPTLEDNSVDSIVTDPPYELGFMGKKWDSSGIAYSVELWAECLRVLKPGGHLLAFGGSRTYHRMAVAIEDAGFEIRDSIAWISNKTFPKSLDISKAIDGKLGAQRDVIGIDKVRGKNGGMLGRANPESQNYDKSTVGVGVTYITEPATPEAKEWEGWGTALKPSVEPIVMARKPLIGTVAENVLQYGTGGINIDATRLPTNDKLNGGTYGGSFGAKRNEEGKLPKAIGSNDKGRWPANAILDETAAQILDQQEPNASRFFFVGKTTKADRNEGLEELPKKDSKTMEGGATLDGNLASTEPRQNFHPTVKPTKLMQYLIKLVTPAGGIVLDPFTGSGSTGKAAVLDGYQFLGIELTAEYLPIIEGRLKYAERQAAERLL